MTARRVGPEPSALLAGDRRALAKAITLVESCHSEHFAAARDLLDALMPATGNSIRIGISGTPGVGKSTFIECFGLFLVELGHRVAVLAVDPSSPVGGGSILGDKTRMQELARSPAAFIRPSPSAGAHGGVAQHTREAMLLCEAANFDVVIVETVGVGQSEFDVAAMVDFFLLLMQPNAGDELQGIKRGILELADAMVINKADGDNREAAARTQRQYRSALQLVAHPNDWQAPVLTCSALEKRGIDELWHTIAAFRSQMAEQLQRRRARQNVQWMEQLLNDMVRASLRRDEEVKRRRRDLELQVMQGTISARAAAEELFALLTGA